MRYPEDFINKVIQGDCLEVMKQMPDECVDCIITSPPYYGLRDYGVEGQLGLEKTLDEYLEKMLTITAELKRVLKPTGTMWWNHGDSYNGTKVGNTETEKNPRVVSGSFRKEKQQMPEKCLMLQAHRLAIRMIDEQKWILRNTIIWHKPNCMPSSVKDRFTVDFEPVFFLTKSKRYYFEPQYDPQIDWGLRDRKEGKFKKAGLANGLSGELNPLGRNKRCVWKIPTKPYPEAHFATFPPALIETPIKAGCPGFICKKCGRAREKIFEIEGESVGHKPRIDERYFSGGSGEHKSNKYKEKGYIDCGCNAGWRSGIVLDPFMGSGTTALVARSIRRNYIGIELSGEYIKLANKRLSQQVLL